MGARMCRDFLTRGKGGQELRGEDARRAGKEGGGGRREDVGVDDVECM